MNEEDKIKIGLLSKPIIIPRKDSGLVTVTDLLADLLIKEAE